ncbi:YfgM family protein [Niveibacterium terrae]|uniref:YfgM family protein n=1 Tax=Niveibacterium terrae TaxID=3373598 RepID=UPI003A906A66
MAAFDLEEQEQLASMKAWWEKWGNPITAIVVAIALVVLGWRGWTWYSARKADEASNIYSMLLVAAEKNDIQKVREASGILAEKYSGTSYADLSALMAAQIQSEAGDKASAKTKLKWAAEKANDPLMRDLARLRLAALLLDEKAFDEALKQLSVKPAPSFAVRYADMRGDVLSLQGKKVEARAAYKEALDAVIADKNSSPAMRGLLELKIDALGDA